MILKLIVDAFPAKRKGDSVRIDGDSRILVIGKVNFYTALFNLQ